MQPISLPERIALSEKLRGLKQTVAEAVTDEFFQHHPDWLMRYGERGRKHGVEDACFHIDFLAGAVESGTSTPFEDYARWTVRMLEARRIPAHFVAENLEQISRALGFRLSGAGTNVGEFIHPRRLRGLQRPTRTGTAARGPNQPGAEPTPVSRGHSEGAAQGRRSRSCPRPFGRAIRSSTSTWKSSRSRFIKWDGSGSRTRSRLPKSTWRRPSPSTSSLRPTPIFPPPTLGGGTWS